MLEQLARQRNDAFGRQRGVIEIEAEIAIDLQVDQPSADEMLCTPCHGSMAAIMPSRTGYRRSRR